MNMEDVNEISHDRSRLRDGAVNPDNDNHATPPNQHTLTEPLAKQPQQLALS